MSDANVVDVFVDAWLFGLGEKVRVEAALIKSEAVPFDSEAVWRLWDAVFAEEKRQRAEWVIGELASETEERALRRELGDDYDATLNAQIEEVKALVLQRADMLVGRGAAGIDLADGHLDVDEIANQLRSDLRQAVAACIESVQFGVEVALEFNLEDLARDSVGLALSQDFAQLMRRAQPALAAALGELRTGLEAEGLAIARFFEGHAAADMEPTRIE
ncbi:MAG: hypothetical protein ACR2HN_08900 [Tepidiformaceae bacterium]